MAHCYALKAKKWADCKGNAQWHDADRRMCNHFGVEPHAEKWYLNWENVFGQAWAMGMDFDKIREAMKKHPEIYKEDIHKVLDWIEEHYDIQTWREL